MTKEEIKELGWMPTECKIGTLYFKDGFFCHICEDGNVKVFHTSDDMNPLGVASSADEIKELMKKHDLSVIKKLEMELALHRSVFAGKYGVEPEETTPDGKVIQTVTLKVSWVGNEDGEETMFIIKPTKAVKESLKVGDRVKIKIIKLDEPKSLSEMVGEKGIDNMSDGEIINLCHDIYKKTLGYSLESIKINEDGTTTHLHSDEFLDNHPERRDSPEFTEEEELEQARFIAGMAYNLAKEERKMMRQTMKHYECLNPEVINGSLCCDGYCNACRYYNLVDETIIK